MKISFVLHLYQPSYQDEATFKKIAEESYVPLVKFIKSKKDFKVTLNTPLSLLELMDKYGYINWIKDVKDLVDQERVELVGSGAYHPLLTKIPKKFAEGQIILNEYALGYYFGLRQGFEGDNAVLIKNLNGFFPPEMAVNEDLIKLLDDFGYKWVLVDRSALHGVDDNEQNIVYKLKDYNIKIVVRCRSLSNVIAFKRDTTLQGMESIGNYPVVIAIDEETFGHHYSSGFNLLENIYSHLKTNKIDIAHIGALIDDQDTIFTETINESSWGSSDKNIENSNPYPLWDNKENKIHIEQWKLLNNILNQYDSSNKSIEYAIEENIKLWNVKDDLKNVKDDKDIDKIEEMILLYKAMNSDQFWWSSGEILPNNVKLFSTDMVLRSIKIYERLCKHGDNDDLALIISKQSDLISTYLGEKL